MMRLETILKRLSSAVFLLLLLLLRSIFFVARHPIDPGQQRVVALGPGRGNREGAMLVLREAYASFIPLCARQ